jgi:protein-S-isoprenylcysteine O-methyltransferase Ste14
MTTNLNNKSVEKRPDLAAGITRRVVQILVMFIVLWLILFLGCGYLDWTAAWIYLGISLLSVVINAFFMFRTSPETIAERGKPTEVKGWDKLVGGMWFLGQYFLVPLVAALDNRFGWTKEYSMWWQALGALVYALALGLTSWAMISNAYFSTAVRIQTDRGQKVCRTGPYHYVRHPGYVGFFIQSLSVPILLGSLWALLFALPALVVMIIRTSLEDRMLQAELEGYKEYAQEVKYRLIPGVW